MTFDAPAPALFDRALVPGRSIHVWLPPGYHQQPRRRYPTLYVHDGQCCLSNDEGGSSGGGGEGSRWDLNCALSRLVTAGEISPAIVVMLDSCGGGHLLDMDLPLGPEMPPVPLLRRRWLEYGDNPLGRKYIGYVCDVVKPAIDAKFRTLPSPEHTSAMGSSMGGLCAFLSAWRRPDVFAHAACLSPVFQLPLITEVALRRRLRPDARLYIDNGGDTARASYSVEGQRFRAVLDTGSPFLLVPGRLPASGCDDRWGCYADSTASVALGDATTEGFGGQDVGVEWRRGRLDFGDFSFSPINFGVVTSSVRKGGTSAIYLGLVRDRVPRVRPTLLEQTDIQSFQFDFPRRRLTLARRPLLRQRDAIPLVDLRPLGAPVAQYACRVERLLVNRAEVPLSRPAVAVLDTGTTGLVLSDSLYQSDELPLPGAAMRDVEVIVRTERGRPVALHASSRRYRQSDGEPEEFPLIVTPVSLPWFGLSAPTPLGTPLNFDSSLPPADSAPRPIVLRPRPASALDPAAQARRQLQLTVDLDAMRMSAVEAPATPGSAESFGVRRWWSQRP
ncbi:hypothetical protein EMIHUDRAFT_112291 [Emiliania huxleyi CCMP1516]|uniref:Peptidase A1 domain-containing protein n=2 Tax=Emiliania huxleyi TaxID=2903 RepID=A0A0D3KA02_EMIH1|nr:hypothetical protein EMIHUDRAFT_112291 [Emiliania huxleyi CCMP1516]EOD32587.1 hypothetical protein EMIHUDRAFT_112291 [Emiliania huxleyi CCMP1516]|eukprot:XP_005785016.1 hypothetical protein EMIHUDRAFT_112291 [Emiliania huxleyi CCMP1516]